MAASAGFLIASQTVTPLSPVDHTLATPRQATMQSARSLSMAFQPIVDLQARRTIAFEALVRGHANQPASTVLVAPRHRDRASIDRTCQRTAIELACTLGVLDSGADLCINVNPRAASSDLPGLPSTVAAAERAGLPLTRLILEITENERLRNPRRLRSLLQPYREQGLRVAIDDFGSGFAGLSLLAAFQPDLLKIDIALTRHLEARPPSRAIVRSIVHICRDLDIQLVAEGVETSVEAETLQDLGIRYMQGHHFAAPAFETLPLWPPE